MVKADNRTKNKFLVKNTPVKDRTAMNTKSFLKKEEKGSSSKNFLRDNLSKGGMGTGSRKNFLAEDQQVTKNTTKSSKSGEKIITSNSRTNLTNQKSSSKI